MKAPESLRKKNAERQAFSRFRWLLLGGLLIVAFSGCGPARPHLVPVSGRVTFGGNAPPAETMLYFVPVEGGSADPRPRSGRALADAEGNFQVTSFETGDGLMPGRYAVRLECWAEAPTMRTPGVSHVPRDFSPLDLEVPATGSANYAVDVLRNR